MAKKAKEKAMSQNVFSEEREKEVFWEMHIK